MTNLLVTFIILNIINVILQTVKSIVTVKCGKVVASLTNAIAFGLYTIVTVYTMCELPLMIKAGIVALTNLIGVFIVKLIEEKTRKDKLWKVEATVFSKDICLDLEVKNIAYNCLTTNRHNEFIINCYCKTQAESVIVKAILKEYNAKYFVTESKIL